MRTVMKKLFISLIRTYQLCNSPLRSLSFRYFSAWSENALRAIKVHGILKGSFLATHRVLRCPPDFEGRHGLVAKKNFKKSPDK